MRYTILLITLLISTFSFCQVNNSNLVEKITNSGFFHNYNVENFYLHTNKDVYFTGENIFFKAYVVNEVDNTPNMDTKNLHVNLYNNENKLVSSQLFHVEEGKTNGSIKLPAHLKSGQYTIQLDTQWNRNFKSGSNFLILVKNIDQTDFSTTVTTDIETTEEPITFYPESGSLIENNENVIYFKVKNDNVKAPIGRIVETKTGRRVAKIFPINSNYAKSTFFYDSEFTAIINVDGKKEKITIPKANKTGFTLYKTKSEKDDVINFQLSTNRETIKKQKFIYAVHHKKGVLKTKASFNLTENILNYNFNILKSDLFPGLNTISVFDNQNKLLIERSFFYKDKKKVDILAKVISQSQDSTTLDLNLININKATNISISVLHEDSEVINYNTSITNTLLYQDTNFNTSESTDLYFQQQTLENSFVYKSKDKQLPFSKEYGIKLIGSLNAPVKEPTSYQVALTSSTNEIFTTTDLKADKKFKFEKLYLTHPSEFTLLLLNKNGKSRESRFYIYNINTDYVAFNTLQNPISFRSDFIKPKITKKIYTQSELEVPKFISKNVEQLDEVVLEDVQKRNEKRIKQIKKENLYLAINAGLSRDYLIDPDKDFQTLEQYLRTITGIRVVNDTSLIRVLNARPGGNFKQQNYISIVIDGNFITQKAGGLQNPHRPVTDFELISVNLSGLGNGIVHQNGVINLVTRKGKSITSNSYVSKNYKTTNGYNLNQETLSDSNLFYPSKSSEYAFSTIDWIPDFTLDPSAPNTIKIKKPIGEHVQLIINGVSLDGELIYKVIELKAPLE
ncbi:hypothetical protein [Olleya sp. 1-3]|uniref:hypothetical protein n=1 Tax=Olleya sp. 1-3 TaxID=2058323 RepID=UPI000C327855|nr:hypothetical protein [Olleya sp. 1-3]PKG52378.1 hypothetical protein CXF54_04725 [Olleya sp. 1-3]